MMSDLLINFCTIWLAYGVGMRIWAFMIDVMTYQEV